MFLVSLALFPFGAVQARFLTRPTAVYRARDGAEVIGVREGQNETIQVLRLLD